MRLAKRNHSPLSTVDAFDRLLDDVFTGPFSLWRGGDPFRDIGSWNNHSFTNIASYPVRKTENDDGTIRVEFDVPGMDKKDLQLSYENDVLSLTSKIKEESGNNVSTRSINYKILAPDLDVSTVKATCSKGILTVTASPIKEAENKHTIEIK